MNAKPLQFVKPADFHARARAALDDPKLRQSFRGAMDFYRTSAAPSSRMATNWNACATSAKPCASTRWRACPTCWCSWKTS